MLWNCLDLVLYDIEGLEISLPSHFCAQGHLIYGFAPCVITYPCPNLIYYFVQMSSVHTSSYSCIIWTSQMRTFIKHYYIQVSLFTHSYFSVHLIISPTCCYQNKTSCTKGVQCTWMTVEYSVLIIEYAVECCWLLYVSKLRIKLYTVSKC